MIAIQYGRFFLNANPVKGLEVKICATLNTVYTDLVHVNGNFSDPSIILTQKQKTGEKNSKHLSNWNIIHVLKYYLKAKNSI